MKQESSSQSKTKETDKFSDGKRYFAWPETVFLELIIDKDHPWKPEDDISNVWTTNGQRLILVNWTLLEKWKSRKRKK